MHEITVISGKGGTGKTSITAGFANLFENIVLCDLDVDAANLHLVVNHKIKKQEKFFSGFEARIDNSKCVKCGRCYELCRFDAIEKLENNYVVNSSYCEGCGVCVDLCPSQAVLFDERDCGDWFLSENKDFPFVHARLKAGEENSGKLVTKLKQEARELAKKENKNIILCDGSPGIGCPVISSLAGTNLAVIVTEPTPSGLHDLKRIADLCNHFSVLKTVIINKYDINSKKSEEIENYCSQNNIRLAGKIPVDKTFFEAIEKKKTILDFESPAKKNIIDVWYNVNSYLETL